MSAAALIALSLLNPKPPAAAEPYRLVPYHAPRLTRSRRVRLAPIAATKDVAAGKSILVDGIKVGEAPEQSEFGFAACYRPKGIAVNVSGVTSGAYTFGTQFAYVKWPGFARAYSGLGVEGVSRDGTILLLHEDEGPSRDSIEPTQGYLERNGVRTAIGPSTNATILPDGTVIGTALRNGNGTYAAQMTDGAASPETFVWSHGKRTPIGRWVFLRRSPDGTILGATTEGGTLDTLFAASGLILYRHGATTTLDIGSLPPRGGCFLRRNGSVVFGVAGEGYSTRGIAIWRDGRIERIPERIGNHNLFWSSFHVGAKDEILVEDEQNRFWRIVRTTGGSV